MGSSGDINTMDPAMAYDATSLQPVRMIFEPLLTYARDGKTLIPLLAAAMPSESPDGKTWTFHLRTGVSFVKGDGTKVRDITAADVAFSLNRVLDPNLKPNPSPVGAGFYSNIVGAPEVLAGKAKTASGIKTPDATTIEITISEPDQTFLNTMAATFASIVPKEFATEDTSAFSASPVGTGPYVLKSYAKGSKAVFVRNAAYWGTPPSLDQVEIAVDLNDTAAIQQIKVGDLDVLIDPLPAAAIVEAKNDPDLASRLFALVGNNVSYLTIDGTANDSPLAKVGVRQAIAYAIDKVKLAEVAKGGQIPGDCIFPPNLPGGDLPCHSYPLDPAKAKQLLSDAGYPNGFTTQIYTDNSDTSKLSAEDIQADLAVVGIKADVVLQSFDVLITTLTTPGKAPLGYISWFQDYPDPSDFIDPILSCAAAQPGGFNGSHWCDPAVDKLAATARRDPDPARRRTEYTDIQNRILDAVGILPVGYQITYELVSPRVETFYMHPVWLEEPVGYSVKG
jgi:ABC-type transport system substrate-binding protein